LDEYKLKSLDLGRLNDSRRLIGTKKQGFLCFSVFRVCGLPGKDAEDLGDSEGVR